MQLFTEENAASNEAALFYEAYHIIGGTIQDITNFFQSKQCDIIPLLDGIQRLVVNSGF